MLLIFQDHTHLVLMLYVFFQNGADDVKRHRFFKNLDWEDVYEKKLKVSVRWFYAKL